MNGPGQTNLAAPSLLFTIRPVSSMVQGRQRLYVRTDAEQEESGPALWLTDLVPFLVRELSRQFAIPFPPGGTASRFYSIHSYSVSLSLCAASETLLSRPHPSCMPEGAFFTSLCIEHIKCAGGSVELYYCLAPGARGPPWRSRPTMSSPVPISSPSLPARVHSCGCRTMEAGHTLVNSGDWKEEGRMDKNRPRFTNRSFTGRGMGEAGRRVEALPCTNICSAWSPLAILLQIPMSRNYDIASMILRRLHL
ncbi:hypothetical protein EDB92DRAFT_1035786 [Lactarius akahatsu]|uniref:Uncharacterized protein n=1 Tax=Lactarius akahatsu TaxID=416441 RepID=A0AAD4LE88_9AGAM|nr:hypothetical protein EDB92DRAFT_1035786 [Lactarius akahatsu]